MNERQKHHRETFQKDSARFLFLSFNKDQTSKVYEFQSHVQPENVIGMEKFMEWDKVRSDHERYNASKTGSDQMGKLGSIRIPVSDSIRFDR
jgi:hypothetical protein